MRASPIILFDGVCNFCNQAVQFVLRHDRQKRFMFAPLQSPRGRALLQQAGLGQEHLETMVLISNGEVYTKSTAALQILKRLGGAWRLLYAFVLVPRPVRDYFYGLLARNRYRWFGKRAECMVPTPDVKERFFQ